MMTNTARYMDRVDAARILANALEHVFSPDMLVLGIPRGGVIVAAEVARLLQAQLDVIVVRKIGAPTNPELAIGAVTAFGVLHLDRALIAHLGVAEATLTGLIADQQALARTRYRTYARDRISPSLQSRTVVLVDDGLATGTTMGLALEVVRSQGVARTIVAVPVAARSSLAVVARYADEIVCPLISDDFRSVGEFYANFDEVTDDDVVNVLSESAVAPDE
jgi:predicted phosphoribosyltransferase